MSCHPSGWWNWYMREDEKKKENENLWNDESNVEEVGNTNKYRYLVQ